MSEVKGLLKTIAREEEEEQDGEEGAGEVRAFMMAYRSFSEEFTNMLKVLLVGKLSMGYRCIFHIIYPGKKYHNNDHIAI